MDGVNDRIPHRRRLVASAAGAALLLAACGGGDGDSSSSGAVASSGSAPAPVPDLVEVQAVADVATNQLPDLVVDDLGNDNKVNLRNYGVGDRATLVWMWAPH